MFNIKKQKKMKKEKNKLKKKEGEIQKKVKKKCSYNFKCTNICCQKNFYFKRMSILWKSIKFNYIFWTTSLISVALIAFYTNTNESIRSKIASSIISFILAMYFGYTVHSLSHTHDACLLYNDSNSPTIKYLKSKPKIHRAIINFFTYTFDFHDKIHHDSKINKKPINILIETIINFIVEGGLLILFTTYFKFSVNIKSYTFKFNRAILFLWAMLYATVHNINYNILPPIQHVNHHKEYNTNFGIDTLDILFDTKYDIENIEIFNHGAINIAIITFFILYFKIYLT